MKKELFWHSIKEVFWLSIIAFLPLILSLLYQILKSKNFGLAVSLTIHPSEILAFCLSFLAPSIMFLKKTHGKSYKLPFLDFFFFSTIGMYVVAIFFVILIKNNIDPEVISNLNYYIKYAIIFLFVTMLYRMYSTYHQSNSTDFVGDKKRDEENFNNSFKSMLDGN